MLCACAGSNHSLVDGDASSTQSAAGEHSTATRSTGELAVRVAVRQLGAPYLYGGSDPGGFDCSGLVQYAYTHAGRQLPRTTGGLWQQLQAVPRTDLEVGDVLFFNIEEKMSHVGLYLGDGRFVHAPSSGKTVSIADMGSAYYRSAFIRGGRPR